MGNHQIQTEDKFFYALKHAPCGMAEIDSIGNIIYLNDKGEILLTHVTNTSFTNPENLFDILNAFSPQWVKRVKLHLSAANQTQKEFSEKLSISLTFEGTRKNYSISITKISLESSVVYFEEYSEDIPSNKIIEQAILDKSITQGKFEIASNVLHDVGNAVVGFSSYSTRIKRSLELDNSENLQNLVGFFEAQREPIGIAIGEAKADAIIKIISGIAQTQKNNQQDIEKSISEQQNIINHIQEILNIQRQYVNGTESIEKKPTNLNSIINDCMSMLYASLNKRNITVDLDVNENLPVIKGDRTKLMQVILNILKNSIEAIDVYAVEKSIAVRASISTNTLSLEIQDSGKGFDEETGNKIFTRGFTTKKSGTGLGLDHCRAILEGHDGTIIIESKGLGKGALTTIKFKL